MTVLFISVIGLGACIAALIASMVMVWSSNRSALFSMAVGGVLALAVLACAVLIAFLLTRAAFPG
jgi:ABC-type Mn2+/Zn2+ transport system permease subunit